MINYQELVLLLTTLLFVIFIIEHVSEYLKDVYKYYISMYLDGLESVKSITYLKNINKVLGVIEGYDNWNRERFEFLVHVKNKITKHFSENENLYNVEILENPADIIKMVLNEKEYGFLETIPYVGVDKSFKCGKFDSKDFNIEEAYDLVKYFNRNDIKIVPDVNPKLHMLGIELSKNREL